MQTKPPLRSTPSAPVARPGATGARRLPHSGCDGCLSRHLAVCAALPASETHALEEAVGELALAAGTTLAHEGGPRRDVYTVTRGMLRRVRLPVPGATLSREVFLGAGAALLPPWAGTLLEVTPLQRARHRACARLLRATAPLFRAALPDGIAPRACRRVGVAPERLRHWDDVELGR